MTNTTTTQALPLFSSLSDDALRTEYLGWLALMMNATQVGSLRATGRCYKAVRIIEGLARKRGLNLTGGR